MVDEKEFVVQCHRGFKWRYIQTNERYEILTAHILEHPFLYEGSHEIHVYKIGRYT